MGQDVYAALRDGFTDPIRDVLWGHIYLTPELAALTKSAPFMRLYRIFQLGPAYAVYPGATHTRAAHSIGVYHLARRLLLNLANRGAESWLSPVGAVSFLCAALLHDLGHFPYTHSLKELPLRRHEELTAEIILSEPVKSLVARAGGDPALSAAIVDTGLPVGSEKEPVFYRKLLSGVLDPDKLDYLNRDARYCGVPYGAQDVDFILSRLYPHQEQGVTIDSKGIPSVESILFSKYLMYRAVYWHPIVRSATGMVKKALLAGLEEGIIRAEELYGLDDAGLFALLASRPHPLFRLVEQVRIGRFYGAVAEFPFNGADHRDLLDISRRSRYEEALATELSEALGETLRPEDVLIDVPEPISFETGLYVSDEGCYFSESSSVFNAGSVESFVKSLRIIRIFVDPEHENRVKSCSKLNEILHIRKKWLNLM
ncbi:metal dependent phosphohydrolase [Treponema primitia ZAS-2]|uniref:Metal dependent phosphohydrolase n=1 Tax=Treponema primitia (strain ATCC BAA-887 / DSM 12427 / ZAS-2) TaxID=545694 RepID=F5YJZ7_TREPZ|nr:HD domain-containing protein [Treponema primitia]AEF85121.1 metal dependent phosphohydrolase [Treponema primitia ZAS-2]